MSDHSRIHFQVTCNVSYYVRAGVETHKKVMSFDMMGTMCFCSLRKLQDSHVDDVANDAVPVQDYLASYSSNATRN